MKAAALVLSGGEHEVQRRPRVWVIGSFGAVFSWPLAMATVTREELG